jgi:predicted ABC-type ATPase
MPILTVFAGPNGSGKSSLIRQVEFEGRENLLEADAIARRIKPELPQQAGILAGREVLRRTAAYIRSSESFADRNHPGRKLEERCDNRSAGTIVLHETLLYLPG